MPLEEQVEIFDEILEKREYQDSIHGGPKHDDEHGPDDWLIFIDQYNTHGFSHVASSDRLNYRDTLINIAALAVAAIESFDRQEAKENDG
jgi:hypothetical protein